MRNAIEIYEFSPIYQSEQNRNGEWVSKGFYGNQVTNQDHSTHEVLQSVFKTDLHGEIQINSLQPTFEIPDTYPPQPGEKALIARDLGKYCILAVANRQKDNKNREFVGYRCFWLKKEDLGITDADGIATLVEFWERNNRPSLDLNPHHPTSYQGHSVIVITRQKYLKNYSPSIQSLFNQIKTNPALFEANKDGQELTPGQLHCLALKVIEKCEVSFQGWAWNVRRLEQFHDLNAIYCADPTALTYFSSKVDAMNEQRLLSKSQTSPNSPKYPPIPPNEEDNIRRILLDLARNPNKEDQVSQLLDYFQTYGPGLHRTGDKQVKSNFKGDTNPSSSTINHITLLVIIGFDLSKSVIDSEIGDMGIGLLKLKREYQQIAVEFIENLLTSIRVNRGHPGAYQLIGQAKRVQKILENNLSESKFPNIFNHIKKNFGEGDSDNDPFSDYLQQLSRKRKLSKNRKRSRKIMDDSQQEIANNDSDESNNTLLLLSMGTLLIVGIIVSILIVFFDLPSWFSEKTSSTNSESNKSLTTDVEKTKLSDEEILSLLIKAQNENSDLSLIEESKSDIANYLKRKSGELESSKSQGDITKLESIRTSEIYKHILTSYLSNLIIDNLPDLPKANSSTEDKDVKVLQDMLSRNKWYIGEITGEFDEETKKAVKKVQEEYKLSQDGVVGKGTWEVILPRITDYQVEETLNFMVKSLEKYKLYTEIIKQLNECKANPQPLQFTICLEEKP
ncbi:MAG: peptidoglycan-binding protein [Gomphosphaeria aponina SAG 52.96 = DSM 107014]|uniref:Peptidoglycan-binding protein n=1 Tax=Gomphosphaeria aponina SAG 52.96 = DSM 107014 TaxID=1521640 RepID=A0A941GTI9_9CHRO|nr:peptidoglycan-binding protein [Gomphosphaeria aponina SAG 52.96 = DSM 107014]